MLSGNKVIYIIKLLIGQVDRLNGNKGAAVPNLLPCLPLIRLKKRKVLLSPVFFVVSTGHVIQFWLMRWEDSMGSFSDKKDQMQLVPILPFFFLEHEYRCYFWSDACHFIVRKQYTWRQNTHTLRIMKQHTVSWSLRHFTKPRTSNFLIYLYVR